MKKFALIGFDTPQYFGGYHLPLVQIPVYGNMTNEEVAEQVQTEMNLNWELYESWVNQEDQELISEYIDSLLETPEAIFVKPEYVEEVGEEPNYLYFSFCNPKVINGITFLNE